MLVAVTIVPMRKIRHFCDLHMRRLPFPAAAGELVGADIDQARHMAVIGVIDSDDMAIAGVGPRQADREITRFAARVYKEADVQQVRKLRGKTAGIARDAKRSTRSLPSISSDFRCGRCAACCASTPAAFTLGSGYP